MKTKFFGALLFIAGLILSLITNLYTGDEEVVSFYNDYKKEVLYLGASLVALSIILTIFLESPEKNAPNKSQFSAGYFFRIVGMTLQCLLIGLLTGLIVFWVLQIFNISDDTIFVIATILTGAILGIRFDHLGFGEITGIILGGFLGFASTYYFNSDFTLEFLPSWLAKKPIIVSAALATI